MARDTPPRRPIGVSPDGQLPLPWLGDALAQSRALAGAHALLIHGPAGVGHLEFGLLLAQAALCEAPGAAASGRACGRCASCHLVATRVHPDLLIVLPDALRVQLGWVDDEDSKLTKADAKPNNEQSPARQGPIVPRSVSPAKSPRSAAEEKKEEPAPQRTVKPAGT